MEQQKRALFTAPEFSLQRRKRKQLVISLINRLLNLLVERIAVRRRFLFSFCFWCLLFSFSTPDSHIKCLINVFFDVATPLVLKFLSEFVRNPPDFGFIGKKASLLI